MNVLQKLAIWVDLKTGILELLEDRRTRWFLETFPLTNWLHADASVLDIGCGVCHLTKAMALRSGARVTAMDIGDFRIQSTLGSEFRFMLGDAANLPFQSGTFDIVTLFWTLHHLPKPEVALKEASRVLRSGGQLIIIEDIVKGNSWLSYAIVRLYDRIINLEFFNHPHSNFRLDEWDLLASQSFSAKILEKSLIPSPIKILPMSFGVLRYRKAE